MTLPRLAPAPTLGVRPLYEFLATGAVAERYREIKATLGVPWVGVLLLAYARYPKFFECLWRGLKPIAESRAFVAQAEVLRRLTEDGARQFDPPPLRPRLHELGYAERELDQIAAIIEVFSHGNFPYLLIGTATRALMEGLDFAGAGDAAPARAGHGPAVDAPFVMIEEHHADDSLAALYGDIKAALGLPFINSDYRALARWPSYFRLAWRDLLGHVGSEPYERLCVAIHDRAWEAVRGLPNPVPLRAEEVRAAAAADAGIEDVRDLCRLFQHLLPGLVVNVAYFRAQLLNR